MTQLEIWNNRKVKRERTVRRLAGCKQKNTVRNAFQREWFLECVFEADLKTSFLLKDLASHDWQNILSVKETLSAEKTHPSKETMKCVHTWVYFFVCVCQWVHCVFALQTENQNSCNCQQRASVCVVDIWFLSFILCFSLLAFMSFALVHSLYYVSLSLPAHLYCGSRREEMPL